jgi:uncharacterized membrane protein
VSSLYLWIKWLHIVSSTVLLGTGAGIAFFFVRAQRSANVQVIAAVARDVVLADLLFIASAVLLQPTTGLALALMAGYPLGASWLIASIALYVFVGCCWLPVVWMQIRMQRLAQAATDANTPLPPAYFRYYRWWFGLGWPGFLGVLIIFYLMVARPAGH